MSPLVTKEQKWLIGSTFIVGMMAGAYLYLTVFAPQFHDGILPELTPEVSSDSLSIRAAQYGACIESGSTCPSYELDTNGVLTTAPPTALDEDPIVNTVTLEDTMLTKLHDVINKAPIIEYTAPSATPECQTPVGDKYRYVITIGDETQIIDTCRTKFPRQSDLSQFLLGFFEQGTSTTVVE